MDELRNIDAYWQASLYLCLGMLYLMDNPCSGSRSSRSTSSRGYLATGVRTPDSALLTFTSTS